MKTVIILALALSAVMFAADDRVQVKKLGSVTWDPNARKLVWVVQTGSLIDGAFVPASQQRYEISPEEALMAASGEQRGLDEDEAVLLHRLLNILSVYCAQSVEWWEHKDAAEPDGAPGLNTVPAKPSKPQEHKTAPGKTPDSKPVKVAEPRLTPYIGPENQIIATVRI